MNWLYIVAQDINYIYYVLKIYWKSRLNFQSLDESIILKQILDNVDSKGDDIEKEVTHAFEHNCYNV